MHKIPERFCWTKMGAESGEKLGQIMKRKDLERQAGDGLFCWGIGNALGDSILLLASLEGEPQILFSPMPSKAKREDAMPSGVLLWTAYYDQFGNIIPLPDHVIVTSRANSGDMAKSRHFALFCFSKNCLELSGNGNVDVGTIRNLATGNPLGASQVTAVVRKSGDGGGREYPIAFRASLVPPFYARLAQPVLLTKADMELLNEAVHGTVHDWGNVSREFRSATTARVVTENPTQAAMF